MEPLKSLVAVYLLVILLIGLNKWELLWLPISLAGDFSFRSNSNFSFFVGIPFYGEDKALFDKILWFFLFLIKFSLKLLEGKWIYLGSYLRSAYFYNDLPV